MRVLMVGLNGGYLGTIRWRPDIELCVLEEPGIIAAVPGAYRDPAISEVRAAQYQQSGQWLDVARAWHQERPFQIVLPGMEYSVEGAFTLAAELGLRGPGREAVLACTDKLRLREVAAGLGIPQPRFRQVGSAEDVASFHRGTPIVLKPANRRGSVGVIRVQNRDEAEAAWRESTTVDEGYRTADRALSWRYLAEEYIGGYEASVESVVAGGRIAFANVTLKRTVGGRYFTELGHHVPAPIDDSEEKELLEANRSLLMGLSAQDGVFHSEWKLDGGRAYLVECACRAPGDLIPQLIAQSYGFDLYAAFLSVLAGERVDPPQRASRASAVSFFRPPPGVVTGISGIERLAEEPRVFDHFVRLKVGDRVDTFENSWHRAGYFAVACDDHDEVRKLLAELDARVDFAVKPDDPPSGTGPSRQG